MKLLSVNNAGRIGGTLACTYSVVRSLPDIEHHIHVVGQINEDHWKQMFGGLNVSRSGPGMITPGHIEKIRPDFIILNNTTDSACPQWLTMPTLLFRHSARIAPAPHHHQVFASRWLATQCGHAPVEADILYQGVPKPSGVYFRDSEQAPQIGTMAVPERQKWNFHSLNLYRQLSLVSPPESIFEFVGCPPGLREDLRMAVRPRQATFFDAQWDIRCRLSGWDFLIHHNPSLPESFGRVAVEAMRAGCIPLVDDQGGFQETVPHLVPPIGYRCSEQLHFVERLDEISKADYDYRMRMRDRIQSMADETYSHSAFADRLRKAMKTTVENAVKENVA